MRASRVDECVRSLRDELLDLAVELVRRPSETGDEVRAQEVLQERWEDWGLSVDRFVPDGEAVRRHPAYCDDGLPLERANLVARWGEGPRERPAALVLNGHIDVVPVGDRDDWTVDPFAGVVRDGILYGRGACDMKGGLAAASVAVRAAQKLGVTPRRPVLLQSVVGEETGGLGTLAAILRGYRGDGAVLCEPTGLMMYPVHSGALSFRLRIQGRAAHGAMRESGVSAIEKFWLLWQALTDLETRRHRDFRHPLYSPSQLAAPLSIGRLEAGSWPSSVPDHAIAEGRFGVFPGESIEAARSEFETAVRRACEKDPWMRDRPAKVEWFEGQFEPGESDPEGEIPRRLAAAHLSVTGRPLARRGAPYGCDLRLFSRHGDIPAVLYGPGDPSLAHAADECIPVEEMVLATRVLTRLICDLLEGH